jgi:hypothetical protein
MVMHGNQGVYDLINIVYKDLEKLGMWEPLQDLLASSSDDMKVQALWVIGTAVQNNPAAQKSVRSILSHTVPRKDRRKRAYSYARITDHSISPSIPSPPFCPTSPPWPLRPTSSAPKRFTRSQAC